jgi:hypothetical protein
MSWEAAHRLGYLREIYVVMPLIAEIGQQLLLHFDGKEW